MKLCKNCIYFMPNSPARSSTHHIATCAKSELPTIPSLVEGETEPLCKDLRAEGGACGPDAKLFWEQ